MPGYLTPAQMQQAQSAPPAQFDDVFSIDDCSSRQRSPDGGSGMAWTRDPRLRIMAHAIRHEQQGEIALMQEIEGLEAVSTATTNMFRDNVN
jgi:hypothetical protein